MLHLVANTTGILECIFNSEFYINNFGEFKRIKIAVTKLLSTKMLTINMPNIHYVQLLFARLNER